MAKGRFYGVERMAMDVVIAEEKAAGRTVQRLSKAQEREQGCDLISKSPEGVEEPVEVKGWGEPLRTDSGAFTYRGTDVRVQQLERALRDPRFRLEVVANLTAAADGKGVPERLTLRAHEVIDRARSWTFEVLLEGLEDRVRPGERPSA